MNYYIFECNHHDTDKCRESISNNVKCHNLLLHFLTYKITIALGTIFSMNNANENLMDLTSPLIISLPQIKQKQTSKTTDNNVIIVKEASMFNDEFLSVSSTTTRSTRMGRSSLRALVEWCWAAYHAKIPMTML